MKLQEQMLMQRKKTKKERNKAVMKVVMNIKNTTLKRKIHDEII